MASWKHLEQRVENIANIYYMDALKAVPWYLRFLKIAFEKYYEMECSINKW